MLKKIPKPDRRFFLPFLLVIIIMTTFTVTNFQYMQQNAEKQSVASTLTAINSITMALENHIHGITKFANELDTADDLFLLARNQDLSLLDVRPLSRRLLANKNSLQLADNIMVYFKNSGILVDCHSAFYLDNKSLYIHSDAMSFENIKSRYFSTQYYNTFTKLEHLVYFDKTYNNTYAVISSLPVNSENSVIQVIVVIDKAKLLNMITPAHKISGAFFDLLDDTNNYLFGNIKHDHETISDINDYEIKRVGGKKYILYNSPIDNTHWKLTASVPYNEAVKTTTNQKLAVYLSLIISISFCVWYGISIAKSRQKEFNSIVETNLAQNEQLKKYTPHIKEEQLRKLLLGEISHYDTSLSQAEEYVPAAALYCVLRINIKTDTTSEINFAKEMNLKKFIIRNVIEEVYPESVYVNIGLDSICFILHTNSDTNVFQNQLDEISNVIKNVLEGTVNYELSYSFGTIVSSHRELTTSFFEAHNSIILKEMKSEPSIGDENGVFFPVEFETALVSAVKHGSIQTIHSFFDILKTMSVNTSDGICDYLKVCLFRAAAEISEKVDKELSSLEEYKSAFIKLSTQAGQNQSPLFSNILEYISNAFSNPQLSRKLIADEFNISEEYVSMLFKKNLDTTFLNYVEKIRIEQACRYLGSSDAQNIEEIAKKCGYVSTVSFRRAFKKVTGVVPSQYVK